MSKLKPGSLRVTLLLSLSVPTVLFAIALTSYVVSARLGDLNMAFADSIRATADRLASGALYGVFSDDVEYLSALCESALESDQGIERIVITGASGQTFVDRHNRATSSSKAGLLRIESPIWAPSSPISSDGTTAPSDRFRPNLLGQVVVFARDQRIQAAKLRVVRNALLMTFGLLGVTALLAVVVSRRISEPIVRLTGAFERIRKSDYKVRVAESSTDEIGTLERGFNTMARNLENTNQELQCAVDDATRELRRTMQDLVTLNTRLDVAQKKALEASRVKSQFLANMSHEIRTPMNGILGFTRLLQKTELDDTQREFVATINTSVSNLLTIVNDILDFSKFESSEITLAQRPFRLRSCIDEAVSILAPQAHEKHLEFVALVYDDVPDALIGDAIRIRQIVTNLISNAIKFTDKGEVVLRVMLDELDDAKGSVTLMITVTDTGIGISEPDQAGLFNPFQQGSVSGHRRYGGTGLGLSICRHLAEAMHGEISVSSSRGEGSVFCVTLRAQLGESQAPPDGSPFRGLTALLLEPHAVTRASLRNHLLELGMQVTLVAEQELTLEGVTPSIAIVGETPDQDRRRVTLPLIDRLHQLYQIPVLLLSNTNDQQDCPALQAAGVKLCIAKPLGRRQLSAALSKCFEHPAEQTAGETISVKAWGALQGWLTGYQCLVADDNDINLALMRNLLSAYGAAVTTAENGTDALNKIIGNPTDLIFMDIHMPLIDGIEAARQLRACPATADIPIVALTADGSLLGDAAFDGSMFDYVLVKPVMEDELRTLIGHALRIPVPPVVDQEAPNETNGEQGELSVRDLDKALQIAGGSLEMADKLFASLCESMPTDLGQIQQAYVEQDWSAMWESVHRLQGSSAACALPRFCESLARLAGLINTSNQESIGMALSEVQKQADRLADYRWKNSRRVN